MDTNERNIKLITLGAMVQQSIGMNATSGSPPFRIQMFSGDNSGKVLLRRQLPELERQNPHSNAVIYEEDGINKSGITDPYYVPKPKSVKYYGKSEGTEQKD